MAAKESERYIRCYPMTTDCYQPSVNDMFFSAFINFKCLVQASPHFGPISTCVLSKGAKTHVVDTRQLFFFFFFPPLDCCRFITNKNNNLEKNNKKNEMPSFFSFSVVAVPFPFTRLSL